MLPVSYDPKSGIGKGDGVTQEIRVDSYPEETKVRIACIGDGSCFIHSVLKAIDPIYANNPNYVHRTSRASKFRRDLAVLLNKKVDPKDPKSKSYYQKAANGALMELALQQMQLGLTITDSLGQPMDYSLSGIQGLLNSRRDLGDEIYGYITEVLGIDVYVTRLTTTDLQPHIKSLGAKRNPQGNTPYDKGLILVISGNGIHYEIIGIKRNGNIQVIFEQEDPFIKALDTSFNPKL